VWRFQSQEEIWNVLFDWKSGDIVVVVKFFLQFILTKKLSFFGFTWELYLISSGMNIIYISFNDDKNKFKILMIKVINYHVRVVDCDMYFEIERVWIFFFTEYKTVCFIVQLLIGRIFIWQDIIKFETFAN